MKHWRAVTNAGRFLVQLSGTYILHEDRRGRPIQYHSLDGAKRAANKLNHEMTFKTAELFREAHTTHRAIDHINGDIDDNRPENLRVVTLAAK